MSFHAPGTKKGPDRKKKLAGTYGRGVLKGTDPEQS